MLGCAIWRLSGEATAGVRLPSLRIPSVAEEAEELLHTHRNDRSWALRRATKHIYCINKY